MKRIGLFGGSFNPVHAGHVRLARMLISRQLFDEVWFVLSPLNPLKASKTMAPDADRATMLSIALADEPGLRPCLVELAMPRPSYTINTLNSLAAKFPNCKFSLIIGADNWLIFNKWRDHDLIIRNFGVVIYPRPGFEVNLPLPRGVDYIADAPLAPVSSTDLRNGAANPTEWLNPKVLDYIKAHKLYD